MIRIEADFKSIDELLVFAQKLAVKGTGTEESTQEEKGSYAVPTQPTYTAPTQPTYTAPTQPTYTAPTQPTYTAPTQPTYTAPTQPTYTAPTQTVSTSAPTYTPDELARAAMTLMDSGRQQELISLLQSFGVSSLPELKPEQYGMFATALRGMGAQI